MRLFIVNCSLFICRADPSEFEGGLDEESAATQTIVVGIGVDAVENGIGVVVLIQQIVEFQTEDETLEFVLNRGVEK